MLQHAEADPEHWHTIWRDYLLTQLNAAGAVGAISYSHSPPINAKDIQAACGLALRRASAQAPEIRAALEHAKMSSVNAIRGAATSVLSVLS
jgi:hypothetical protein